MPFPFLHRLPVAHSGSQLEATTKATFMSLPSPLGAHKMGCIDVTALSYYFMIVFHTHRLSWRAHISFAFLFPVSSAVLGAWGTCQCVLTDK